MNKKLNKSRKFKLSVMASAATALLGVHALPAMAEDVTYSSFQVAIPDELPYSSNTQVHFLTTPPDASPYAESLAVISASGSSFSGIYTGVSGGSSAALVAKQFYINPLNIESGVFESSIYLAVEPSSAEGINSNNQILSGFYANQSMSVINTTASGFEWTGSGGGSASSGSFSNGTIGALTMQYSGPEFVVTTSGSGSGVAGSITTSNGVSGSNVEVGAGGVNSPLIVMDANTISSITKLNESSTVININPVSSITASSGGAYSALGTDFINATGSGSISGLTGYSTGDGGSGNGTYRIFGTVDQNYGSGDLSRSGVNVNTLQVTVNSLPGYYGSGDGEDLYANSYLRNSSVVADVSGSGDSSPNVSLRSNQLSSVFAANSSSNRVNLSNGGLNTGISVSNAQLNTTIYTGSGFWGGLPSDSGSHVANSAISNSSILINNDRGFSGGETSATFNLSQNSITAQAFGNQSGTVQKVAGVNTITYGNVIDITSPTTISTSDYAGVYIGNNSGSSSISGSGSSSDLISAVRADLVVNNLQINEGQPISSSVRNSSIYIENGNSPYINGTLNVGSNTIASEAKGNQAVNGILIKNSNEMPASLAVASTQFMVSGGVSSEVLDSSIGVFSRNAVSGVASYSISGNSISSNAVGSEAYNTIAVTNASSVVGGSISEEEIYGLGYNGIGSFSGGIGLISGDGALVDARGDIVLANSQVSAASYIEANIRPNIIGLSALQLGVDNVVPMSLDTTQNIYLAVNNNALIASAAANKATNDLTIGTSAIDDLGAQVINTQSSVANFVGARIAGDNDLTSNRATVGVRVGVQEFEGYNTPQTLITDTNVTVNGNSLVAQSDRNISDNRITLSAASSANGFGSDLSIANVQSAFVIPMSGSAVVQSVDIGVSVPLQIGDYDGFERNGGWSGDAVISNSNVYNVVANQVKATATVNSATNLIQASTTAADSTLKISNAQVFVSGGGSDEATSWVNDVVVGLSMSPKVDFSVETGTRLVDHYLWNSDLSGASANTSITVSNQDVLNVHNNLLKSTTILNNADSQILAAGNNASTSLVIANSQATLGFGAYARNNSNTVGVELEYMHNHVETDSAVISGATYSNSGGASVSGTDTIFNVGQGSGSTSVLGSSGGAAMTALNQLNLNVTKNTTSSVAVANSMSNNIAVTDTGTLNSLIGIVSGGNYNTDPSQIAAAGYVLSRNTGNYIGLDQDDMHAHMYVRNTPTVTTTSNLNFTTGSGSNTVTQNSDLAAWSNATANGILDSVINVGGINNGNQITSTAMVNNALNSISVNATNYQAQGNVGSLNTNDLQSIQLVSGGSAESVAYGTIGLNMDEIHADSTAEMSFSTTVVANSTYTGSGSNSLNTTVNLNATGEALSNSRARTISGSTISVGSNRIDSLAVLNNANNSIAINANVAGTDPYDTELGTIRSAQVIQSGSATSRIGDVESVLSRVGLTLDTTHAESSASVNYTVNTAINNTYNGSGSFTGTDAPNVSVNLTADASSIAYGITNSTITVDKNIITSTAVGNSLNNQVAYGGTNVNLRSVGVGSYQEISGFAAISEVTGVYLGVEMDEVSASGSASVTASYSHTGSGTGTGTVNATSTANAEAYGINNSLITIASNQVNSFAYGNNVNNRFSSSAQNLTIAAVDGGTGVRTQQYANSGSSVSSYVNNVLVGLDMDDVTADASATNSLIGFTGGSGSNTATATATAYGIKDSQIFVRDNKVNSVAVTNLAVNTFVTANTNSAVEYAGIQNLQTTSSNTSSYSFINDVDVGLVLGGVNANATATGGSGSTSTSTNYGVYNSAIVINGNQIIGNAVGNYADNLLQVTTTTLNASGLGIENRQINAGSVTSMVDDVRVGVSLGSDAEQITASTSRFDVQGNKIASQGTANNAFNAVQLNTSQLSGSSTVESPAAGIINEQNNSASVYSTVQNSRIGLFNLQNADGYNANTVMNNAVSSLANGNNVVNTVALNLPSATMSSGLMSTNSTQINSGEIRSQVTNVQIGIGNAGGGSNGSALGVVKGNSIQSIAIGNSATNVITIQGR